MVCNMTPCQKVIQVGVRGKLAPVVHNNIIKFARLLEEDWYAENHVDHDLIRALL